MTNKEAIEYAKATNYCAGCTDYECIDDDCKDCEHKSFFKMAIEALEKQDKYRWHDLRKNPEDLPNDESSVIVYVVHDYSDVDGWWSCDFAWYKDWWFTNNFCRGIDSRGYKVIAWRKNEPFEGVRQ